MRLRTWWFTLLKLVWGVYLVLTSLYCLLAFLPYTYFAFVKAPAYEWMPWFVQHHALLYWIGLLAAAIAIWPMKRSRGYFGIVGVLAAAGTYLAVRPFMSTLQNNSAAYWWSLAALAPLALTAALDIREQWPADEDDHDFLLTYSSGAMVAVLAALLYGAGVEVRNYVEKKAWSFDSARLELTVWSVISHLLVAIIALSVLNLIALTARRTRRPRGARLVLIGLLVFSGFWTILVRFLNNAMTFEGVAAQAYAASLAAALTLLLGSLVLPFLNADRAGSGQRLKLVPLVTAVVLSGLALALPTLIVGGDWNGVLQHSFTLFFWVTLSICVYSLRPRRATYSLVTILAVLLLSAVTYKALQVSQIYWAKPLGSTDDDVSRAVEKYAAQNASFELVHAVLGESRTVPCGELCRIMRQYTNIRDAVARTDVELVDALAPTQQERPNIFILVIDSLRPDYLGAYNPKADFSPNLDAFARDSFAVRNVFTQYAGTTLSEPAIWSGAMLLHAHYTQPFSKVNSLEKLAKADGYQIVVSYDTVLGQILAPDDDLIKLDTDKPLWNQFEVCSTLQQTASALDARADKTRPVLFYAQPMNVHHFASNHMPRMTEANWRMRTGFNNRIAYEVHQVDDCLGSFLNYLKSRGLYDKSIIIVTSDHGDATGEFGRYSHSLSIYPEVMRVPLLVHLPTSMRNKFVYDDSGLSALTDITPSLYYLLGHRPIRQNPLFGHPLFVEDKKELEPYRRSELFLASDERAVYGLLADNGRFLYATYDSPAQSFLFDLGRDPNAERSVLTPRLKQEYDERIIQYLHLVADFYGYKPGVGTLLAATH
jgi:phosphoglycerol transferase MdoB-like AlkP superfamily enzyme